MGQSWLMDTPEKLDNFIAFATQAMQAGKPVTADIFTGKRTLPQNDLIHAVYREVAKQKEDESVVDITRHCKLYYGVPLLRGCNERFKALYDKGIKPYLSTEEKLLAMDILPVTRLMDKKQATEYIDTIVREYSQQGYYITRPGE